MSDVEPLGVTRVPPQRRSHRTSQSHRRRLESFALHAFVIQRGDPQSDRRMATEHLTAASVRTVDGPRAFHWPAALIFWGRGFGCARPSHSHHNAELAMALKGRFRIRLAPSRPWIVCEAALIKADARHQIDASTSPMLCALVDPESEF